MTKATGILFAAYAAIVLISSASLPNVLGFSPPGAVTNIMYQHQMVLFHIVDRPCNNHLVNIITNDT